MIKGTIKVRNYSLWRGFLKGVDCEDYYLHASEARTGQSVSNNSRVKFDVSQGQRGPVSENVTLS